MVIQITVYYTFKTNYTLNSWCDTSKTKSKNIWLISNTLRHINNRIQRELYKTSFIQQRPYLQHSQLSQNIRLVVLPEFQYSEQTVHEIISAL